MDDETQREWNYRYEERLGILCEDGETTAEQRAIARHEADAWLLRDLYAQIDAMP